MNCVFKSPGESYATTAVLHAKDSKRHLETLHI